MLADARNFLWNDKTLDPLNPGQDFGPADDHLIDSTPGTSSTGSCRQEYIILLTDGQDTVSQVHMRDATNQAVKADALIYAIGIGDRYQFGVDEGSLKKLTHATGGRAYFPRNQRDLQDAFAQIEKDLREQYLIAYAPSNKSRDGSYRRITIEIVNPEVRKQSLKLNYRPGYFAQAPGSATPSTPKKP